jgi:excisionase family DNA binding protein
MNAQNHDDQLLTTGEAARLLGVSVDTVRSLHRQGRLPAIRTAGGQRRLRGGRRKERRRCWRGASRRQRRDCQRAYLPRPRHARDGPLPEGAPSHGIP